MSDELSNTGAPEQNADALTQDQLDALEQDNGSQEAAPASQHDDEDKPEHAGFLKRISTLTARNRHLQEQLEARQAQERAAAAAAEQAAEKPPEIPDYPDEDLKFDNPAEFKRQLAARDQAIIDRATWNAEKRISEREQSKAEQAQSREAAARRDQIVTAYIENGVMSGLSEERMANNEQAIREAGLNPDTAFFLYSDEAGARIVDYLASNPKELAELNSLHPTQAAVRIANDIKPKALAKKPHATTAPDPAIPSRGTAARVTEWDKVAEGATFE